MENACNKEGLEWPKVKAMAVRDSNEFKNVEPNDPVIVKNRLHGIWIAGYDIERDGKACVRMALSKLLLIEEN